MMDVPSSMVADYGFAIAPLILPQLLFQPLDGSQLIAGAITVTQDMGDKIVFSHARLKKSPWTPLTYMLVHGSSDHLLNNIISLVAAGPSIHGTLGSICLWAIFVGGGVTSALDPFNLKEFQLARSVESKFAFRTEEYHIKQLWNRGVASLADVFAPYLIDECDFIGSSGGVAAVAGANCILIVERVNELRLQYRQTGALPSIPVMLQTIIPLVNLLAYSHGEYVRLASGSSSGIDHAGHITGMIFGAAFATTARMIQCMIL